MMVLTVSRKDLKTAFRNKANFDEFVNDVIDKMKGEKMGAVKMQIVSYIGDNHGTNAKVSIQCPLCGGENEVIMTLDQLYRWRNSSEHVQFIFPEKTSSERELLISGICSTCWDKLFS